jgi:hypothetical protein
LGEGEDKRFKCLVRKSVGADIARRNCPQAIKGHAHIVERQGKIAK